MENGKTAADAAEAERDNGTPEAADEALLANPVEQLAAVTAERDALKAERAELSERLLRRQADFENFRKRVERDRGEFAEYAAMEAVRALLPILDDFERALKTETRDEEYSRGVELIYGRFRDALVKLGLEPIESAGKPFDPNLHHAVEMVPADDAGDQTVLDEYQRGYNFKGRLLRPAMVRVAVKP